jgi:hypothetical protein
MCPATTGPAPAAAPPAADGALSSGSSRCGSSTLVSIVGLWTVASRIRAHA